MHPKTPAFAHERLRVYQQALTFVAWATDITESIPRKAAVRDQLERASSSVPLNIAEGNGKFTYRDRCRFLHNARTATLDCAASLDVMVAKRVLSNEDTAIGKQQLSRIHAMLVGLIQRNAPNRFHKPVRYGLAKKTMRGKRSDYDSD